MTPWPGWSQGDGFETIPKPCRFCSTETNRNHPKPCNLVSDLSHCYTDEIDHFRGKPKPSETIESSQDRNPETMCIEHGSWFRIGSAAGFRSWRIYLA